MSPLFRLKVHDCQVRSLERRYLFPNLRESQSAGSLAHKQNRTERNRQTQRLIVFTVYNSTHKYNHQDYFSQYYLIEVWSRQQRTLWLVCGGCLPGIFSCSCFFKWRSRLVCWPKQRLHRWHLKGFSLLWMLRTCRWRLDEMLKERSQYLHLQREQERERDRDRDREGGEWNRELEP